MFRKLFRFKSRQPNTIGDVIILDKWLVFTCKVCKTITRKNLNRLVYPDNMELHALEAVSECPVCGAANILRNPHLTCGPLLSTQLDALIIVSSAIPWPMT